MPKPGTLIQLLLYQIICYKCVSKSYSLNNFLFFFVNFNVSLNFTPFINQNNSVRRKTIRGKQKPAVPHVLQYDRQRQPFLSIEIAVLIISTAKCYLLMISAPVFPVQWPTLQRGKDFHGFIVLPPSHPLYSIFSLQFL